MGDWDCSNLIHVLQQGMEVAKQLQISLHAPYSSQESHELLIEKIIDAFEKALKMVNLKMGLVGRPSSQMLHSRVAIRTSQSPPLSGSPRNGNSDKDLREINRSSPNERRTKPSWTKQIRVTPGMGVEGSLDDGYTWRKYGQKSIHGAKYPRGYYRCAQRNFEGCMATKQVQRSDQDPTVFEIHYRGNHTCTMASFAVPTLGIPENQEPNFTTIPQQQPSDAMNLHLRLGVLTENLDQSFASSFHQLLTSTIKKEEQVFPSPIIENNYAQNFNCPSYVSPSDTTYFSVDNFRGHPLASSGSEVNDMISAVTSAANSPTLASLNFPFDQFHILDGQNFTFDNSPFS
ncbi:probable WRKY transcription factor 30 [Cajanus cajan]|uniref:WRKY transcription factor 41 n=1 Tax=Cajanus cajan TaxID=3821 RepID=A0A151TYR6_CAJCA|nr:probable WRKY transcription factor 30 [Cajanus cajan]KYP72128.1 putative WRKY transcription factor 41 [Cajanus cajan]